jgi:hypothetical protein
LVTLADPCIGSQNLAHIGRVADGLPRIPRIS